MIRMSKIHRLYEMCCCRPGAWNIISNLHVHVHTFLQMIKSKYINYFECGADILAKLLITLLLQIRFAYKVTAQPEIFEFK